MKFKPRDPKDLLKMTDFLFESNEDLLIALIGGLAAQEILSSRAVRRTSDIDIVTKDKETAEKLVGRLSNIGFQVHYNPDLDKYSVFNWDEGIHIDIYLGKVGTYEIDNKFWERVIQAEGSSIVYASPEDLISIKLYSYLASSRGKEKHLIDICCIILGREEIDTKYLAERFVFLSKILGFEPKYFLNLLKGIEEKKNILTQFTSKEKRMLKEEISYLTKNLEKQLYFIQPQKA
ncbi:MAG: nucleotidyltransferase family protein [Candidatus Aenigmatarchaeota archaeon]